MNKSDSFSVETFPTNCLTCLIGISNCPLDIRRVLGHWPLQKHENKRVLASLSRRLDSILIFNEGRGSAFSSTCCLISLFPERYFWISFKDLEIGSTSNNSGNSIFRLSIWYFFDQNDSQLFAHGLNFW